MYISYICKHTYKYLFTFTFHRNIRRYRRELLKSGTTISKCVRGTFLYLDFIPTTYVLPVDYNLFLAEYRRNPSTWIVKPCGKSRGSGIFLIDKLSQLKKWSKEKKYPKTSSIKKETYIISRYLLFSFLISFCIDRYLHYKII